jgi:hypothetical protein
MPTTTPQFQFDQNRGYYHQLQVGTVTMPDVPADNQVIMLVDVNELSNRTIKLRLCSNAPTVRFDIDWGDGTTTTTRRYAGLAFNNKVSHTYPSGMGVGYQHANYRKQFVILTMRAYAPKTLGSAEYVPTSIGFPTLYGGPGNIAEANPNWLLEVCASCDTSSTVIISKSTPNPTTGVWSEGCTSLRKAIIKFVADPVGVTSSVLPITSAFANCKNLTSLSIVSFGSVRSAANMCYGCSSLADVKLPSSWGNLTNLANAFTDCSSLSAIVIPSSWGNVLYLTGLFQRCTSLTTVTPYGTTAVSGTARLPSTWGSVLDINHMFSCILPGYPQTYGVTNVILPLPTAWTNIRNASYMFTNTRLTSLDFRFPSNHNYAVYPFKVKNMAYMFAYCDNLTTLSNLPKEIHTDVVTNWLSGTYPASMTFDITLRPYTDNTTINLDSMFSGCGVKYRRPLGGVYTVIDLPINPISVILRFPANTATGIPYTTPVSAYMGDVVSNSRCITSLQVLGTASLTNYMPTVRSPGSNFCCLVGGALSISSTVLTNLTLSPDIQFKIYKLTESPVDNPAILLSTAMTTETHMDLIASLRDQYVYPSDHRWILRIPQTSLPGLNDLCVAKRWTLVTGDVNPWPLADYTSGAYVAITKPRVEQ